MDQEQYQRLTEETRFGIYWQLKLEEFVLYREDKLKLQVFKHIIIKMFPDSPYLTDGTERVSSQTIKYDAQLN